MVRKRENPHGLNDFGEKLRDLKRVKELMEVQPVSEQVKGLPSRQLTNEEFERYIGGSRSLRDQEFYFKAVWKGGMKNGLPLYDILDRTGRVMARETSARP